MRPAMSAAVLRRVVKKRQALRFLALTTTLLLSACASVPRHRATPMLPARRLPRRRQARLPCIYIGKAYSALRTALRFLSGNATSVPSRPIPGFVSMSSQGPTMSAARRPKRQAPRVSKSRRARLGSSRRRSAWVSLRRAALSSRSHLRRVAQPSPAVNAPRRFIERMNLIEKVRCATGSWNGNFRGAIASSLY